MHRLTTLAQLCLTAACIAAASQPAHAEDWPQWRGVNSDGVVRDDQLLKTLPKG